MTVVLGFDTTAGACSAAVLVDGAVAAHRCEPMARGHAEALVPMIVAVLAESSRAARDLDGIGVTVGPGAFTGLRIGLAAARGIALAAGVPAVGVTSLEALAHGTDPAERAGHLVVAAIDTKRGDLYVQPFDDALRPLDEPRVATPMAAAALGGGRPVLVAGDGTIPGAARASAPPWPDARVVAALAAARLDTAPAPPRPLYLREPEARLPEPGR